MSRVVLKFTKFIENLIYFYLKYVRMARKSTRGAEVEIEKARNDARWADIPKLLNDVETSKASLSGAFDLYHW